MSKQPWPGLFSAIRRFLYGEANPPKAKRYGETTTPTASSYYEGMHRYYRWFRKDSFTRKCILTNTYFVTMTSGFETALEAAGDDIDLEDYTYVNKGIDARYGYSSVGAILRSFGIISGIMYYTFALEPIPRTIGYITRASYSRI